ncbi:hypothetical protein ABK905_04030 [Acerihabitans sp. KWT182]|uniref:Uncharacterized protein n=1 Tax=Acerihabitans sp. KWT182 TaxID=3157919 RepID=A0AAU7QBS1_9GAMM
MIEFEMPTDIFGGNKAGQAAGRVNRPRQGPSSKAKNVPQTFTPK